MSGRIRTIKPEWLEDELIGQASDAARLMSVALLLLADDYGRGRANAAMVATRVFPPRADHPESVEESFRKFDLALAELVRIRFVQVYSVNGQKYFAVRNWSKHQKVQHAGKPLVPPPPEDPHASLTKPSRESQESSGESHASLTPDRRPTTNDRRPRPEAGASPSSSSSGDHETEESTIETVCHLEQSDPPSALDATTDSDRETPCPADLAERFAGYPDFVKKFGAAESELRVEAERFVGYWTIGKGAGKRRDHWAGRLREDLRKKFDPNEAGCGIARAKSRQPDYESGLHLAASGSTESFVEAYER